MHVIFWVLAVLVQEITFWSDMYYPELNTVIFQYLLWISFKLIIFYVFYFSLSLKFFEKKKLIVFVISGLVFTLLINVLFSYVFILIIFPGKSAPFAPSGLFRMIYADIITYLFVFAVLGALFRAASEWYKKSKEQEALEKQNIADELALLHSKINPEFLFFTLNNINSFIFSNPDKASYCMILLSGIMWYMLYDANNKKVTLDQEIELIKKYIELQCIGNINPEYVKFNTEANTSGISIPPLMFMPLIENAFQLGKAQNVSPAIIINLFTKNGIICFDTFNYIQDNKYHSLVTTIPGLEDIRKRFDLLYKNKYKLSILKNKNNISIKLEFAYQ